MARQTSQFPMLVTMTMNASQFAQLEAHCAWRKMRKTELLRQLVFSQLGELPASAEPTPATEP
jgi:hypothetical protein